MSDRRGELSSATVGELTARPRGRADRVELFNDGVVDERVRRAELDEHAQLEIRAVALRQISPASGYEPDDF